MCSIIILLIFILVAVELSGAVSGLSASSRPTPQAQPTFVLSSLCLRVDKHREGIVSLVNFFMAVELSGAVRGLSASSRSTREAPPMLVFFSLCLHVDKL